MRSFVLRAFLVSLVATLPAMGQYRTQPSSGATSEYLRNHEEGLGLNAVRGLLDPSRMKMSHTASFGYANSGGTGVSRGLYMNHIDYQIAKPLLLTTHLGYQFQPSGPEEFNPARTGNDFVGGADLTWQPTDNSHFRLSVAKGLSPYRNYGYGNMGYGYGYDNWLFPGRP